MLFTIPSNKPFVDALAAGILSGAWEAEGGAQEFAAQDQAARALDLARIVVLLPTRRAERALAEAFLRFSSGRPMLLPRMIPIGDLDEEELDFTPAGEMEGNLDALTGDREIPPAIPELRRQLLLTRLILALETRGEAPARGTDQAARLARELARLLDQVQTERLDFSRLAELVPGDFAAHWQITLDFLRIVSERWPEILAAEGCLDPAARRNRVIEAQAAAWRRSPPAAPVIAAGTTGSLPATADLIAVVANLPRGAVVLPGLDREMDEESWAILPPTHPQHGLERLLKRLDVRRAEVREWDSPGVASVSPERVRLISEALRPAPTTDGWADLPAPGRRATAGLRRIDCASPREEAGAIAMLLREALEVKGKRAALVTPDRGLARRVAAELKRWNIEIDDSAGVPLARTAPGVYLRLTAELVAGGVEPISLLATCKHPLAAAGMKPAAFRAGTRSFERRLLRGPRPAPGLEGLAAALDAALAEDKEMPGRQKAALLDWFDRLRRGAQTFAEMMTGGEFLLADLLGAHLGFAEALAASDDTSGGERLWRREAGEAAAEFFSDLLEAAADSPPVKGSEYPRLLESLMAGRVVRPRYGSHPRLFIWGPLEARLQNADLVILGGLNEGTWPPSARADPWMSRPMRERFGLPLPERRIGLAAHDFIQAFAAREVVLTRSTRVEGIPTVPSRWLLRLENLLPEGREIAGASDYLHWFLRLDEPPASQPSDPPEPRPPVEARPRRLSVTQVETWIRDPYAIYARAVLALKPMDPVDADPGAAERGAFIHEALDRFVREHPRGLPGDAEERLLAIGREVFGAALARPGVRAFWWPRFEKIARWFIDLERQRRGAGISALATEADGRLELAGGAGKFILTARADRIDRFLDGGLSIMDYKTGAPPSGRQVTRGQAPQLPLEAAIAMAGGFERVAGTDVAELVYAHLTGGDPPGRLKTVEGDPAALAVAAREGLEKLILAFDDPATPYLSRPRPAFPSRFGDYDHLARVKEWSSGLEAAEAMEEEQ